MGKSRKNKSCVFGLETFSEFSDIIKVLVNMLITPANQTQKYLPWCSVDKEILNPGVTQKHSAFLLFLVKRYFRNRRS